MKYLFRAGALCAVLAAALLAAACEIDCSVCEGSGVCRTCEGTGDLRKTLTPEFETPQPPAFTTPAAPAAPAEPCTKCGATGVCQTCNGTGKYSAI